MRPCEDGILVYDNTARTTHLIPPAAWDLFLSLSQANSAVSCCALDESSDSGIPIDDDGRLAMLNALERAGLIMRC